MADKTWHDRYKEARSAGDHVADLLAAFVGSWLFITIHVVWFGVWILYPVERFPYGLLTMIVSLEAILLSTFIIMSQNRQAQRDHHQAQADYDTDREAKKEIEDIQFRLARIEEQKLDKIIKMLEQK